MSIVLCTDQTLALLLLTAVWYINVKQGRHYRSMRMVKKKNDNHKITTTKNLTEQFLVRSQRIFLSSLVGISIAKLLWKIVWQHLRKSNIVSPFNKEIVPLSVYPADMKMYAHTETWILMFISGLFVIMKSWNLARCPSANERVQHCRMCIQ